jgi:hypothetical protein
MVAKQKKPLIRQVPPLNGAAPWDGGIAWSIRRWIGFGTRLTGACRSLPLQASCQLRFGTIPELNQSLTFVVAHRSAVAPPKLGASTEAE